MAFANVVDAYAALMKFAQQRGEFSLRLVLHAAVPQGFTVELLHLLAINFVPEWTSAEAYTGVAHLLSSSLCVDLGTHYEYDPLVRPMLLNELARTNDLENNDPIGQTANFLLGYVDHIQHSMGNAQPTTWWEYLEIQRWTALAFLDPDSAAEQMAAALQHSAELENTGAKARIVIQMSALASSLSQPLFRHEDLLRYIKGRELLEQGQLQRGRELLERYGDRKIRVGEIELSPAAVLAQVGRETDGSLHVDVASSEQEIPDIKMGQEDGEVTSTARILSELLHRVPPMPDTPLYLEEDIASLLQILEAAHKPVMILSVEERLNTHLAIAVCHHPDIQKRFDGGIFWIWGQNIGYEPNRIEYLNHILDILIPSHSALTNIEDFPAIISSFDIDDSVLFILTDVEIIQDLDGFVSLLEPLLENPNSQLLLTTSSANTVPEFECRIFKANTQSLGRIQTEVGHRPQIFISYARADDVSFVERLYNDLRFDFDVWWDRVSMPSRGNSFVDEIRLAIQSSERMVVIIGSNTNEATSSRAEWEYAVSQCLPVHVIRRSGDYVPNALINHEMVDMRDDSETAYSAGLNQLLQQLSSKVPTFGMLYNVPNLPENYRQQGDYNRLKQELLKVEKSVVRATSPVLIQGAGGFGKTTTAAALCRDCEIRRNFSDGIYWFSFGQSPDQLAQYVALGRMLGDEITAYKDEASARSRLQRLIENRHSLIVLDDVWSYSHIQDFISVLSNSVFLITTRNESVVDAVNSRSFVEQDKATTDPIYIIHSTKDDAIVTRIANILSAQDIPVWVDHRDVQLGDRWSESIETALREARAGLFVLSAASVRSDNCTAEWRYILSSMKPLYILRLESIAIEDIPSRLAILQHIDLVPAFDEGVEALIRILKDQRGTAAPASQVPLRLTESALIEEELLGLRLAGRQDELAQALTILRTRPLILVGLGGVGKSRLAAAIVTEGGWQNAIWYRCSTFSSANDVYAFIRKHFSLLPTSSIEEIVESIKQASRLLVVLDNVEELDVAHRGELSQLIETISNAGAAVCITSRDAWEIPGCRLMSLEPLSSADAIQMVLNAAEFYDLSWNNPAEAAEIANAARNHPRLIVWAVGRMSNYPVRQVVGQLKNLGTESVESALVETIGQTIQQLSDSARAALRDLAVCRGGFTYDAARAITQTSTDDDFSELERYRLVTFVPKDNRYNIDELVIATIGKDAAAGRTHFEYYLALAREHARKQDYGGLDVESANIDAAFEWAISADPELALNLASACADYQSNRGRFAQRLDWAERTSRALQSSNDIELLAGAQNNLGVACTQLPTGNRGDNLHRAIAAYHEALRFYTPDAAPLDYALTQSNLGNAHRDLATLEDRETNLHRAIAAYQEAMRFQTPLVAPLNYASTQNSLGAAYSALSLTGDKVANLRRAIAAYEAALAYYTPQTTPLNYATTQNNLGVAYGDLSQVEDRAANLRRAIAAYEAALVYRTPESAPPDYAMTQHNLGVAYADLAQVEDRAANLRRAIAAYEQALVLYRTVGDRLGEAATLRQLGDGWNALGDVQRSLEFYEQSLALSRSLGNQLGEASTLAGIAHQYRSMNDLQRALEYFQQALLLYREVGDKNGEAATLISMGQLNVESGDPSPSREYLSSALVLYRQLGRNDMAEAIEKNLANLAELSNNSIPDGTLIDTVEDSQPPAFSSNAETFLSSDVNQQINKLQQEHRDLNEELRRLSNEIMQTYRPTTKTRLETERAKVEERIRGIESEIRELQRKLPSSVRQGKETEGSPAIQLPEQFFFFSYAGTEGINLAERIYRNLKSQSFPVWMTHEDLDSSGYVGGVDDWLEFVIKQATGIIFVVSKSTPNSSSARYDIPFAQKHNIPIIVVRSDASQIPITLSSFPIVDFNNSRSFQNSIKQLIPEVQQILEGRPRRTDTPSGVTDDQSRLGKITEVYISSTSRDLSDHRKAVQEAVLRMGMYPIMMENFSASSKDALTVSLDMLARSDIYILLFGQRYGYIPDDTRNPDRLSIVELEYNEAIRLGKPVLIFVMDDSHPVSFSSLESDEASRKLREFKEKVMQQHIVAFFTSPEDLRAKVIEALASPQQARRSAMPISSTRTTARTFKVFLSGPGDVDAEKEIVRQTIDKLSKDLSVGISVQDPSDMGQSYSSPQDMINRGLPKPSECDIVIVIFWSRIGTPLVVDGKEYLSGTHWELLDALSSTRPETLLYRRTEMPTFEISDTSRIEQYRKVEEFFKSDFFYDQDGRILRGVNTYREPEEFRKTFEIHFEQVVELILRKLNDQ